MTTDSHAGSNACPQRFAAIDIGTLTCRMLVADVCQGQLSTVAKEYAIANLGEGVDATNHLKPEALARVAAVVDRYRTKLDRLAVPGKGAIPVYAFATSAARDADNSDELERLLARFGITLSVIPGEREAALSFAGASSPFAGSGQRVCVVDIGGGSTEVIVGAAGCEPDAAHSFNIGCRRATERFLPSDPPSAAELDRARSWIAGQFQPYFAQLSERGLGFSRMIAVAGTATTVVSIRESMEMYDSARVDGALVALQDVNEVARRLHVPLAQREQVVGLDPGRAPVIVAGMVILQEVMRAAQVDSYTASESDILHGMILEAAAGR